MTMTRLKILQKFYVNIERLIGDPATYLREGQMLKLKASGYMDLVIERYSSKSVILAHYGELNGDLMSDPCVEFEIDLKNKIAFPLTYEQHYLGMYQEIYDHDEQGKIVAYRPRLQKSIESFCTTWFRNIEMQKFPSYVERLNLTVDNLQPTT
jgi:hypothetical protein